MEKRDFFFKNAYLSKTVMSPLCTYGLKYSLCSLSSVHRETVS